MSTCGGTGKQWRIQHAHVADSGDASVARSPQDTPRQVRSRPSTQSSKRVSCQEPPSSRNARLQMEQPAKRAKSVAHSAEGSRRLPIASSCHTQVPHRRQRRRHDDRGVVHSAEVIRHRSHKDPRTCINGACSSAPHLHSDGARTNRARLVSTVVTRRDDAFWPARRG